jgi:hypothetical protein
MSDDVVDILGRTIHIGDVVTYPQRVGSRMWMSIMRVEEVRPGFIKGTWDGAPRRTSVLDRVVKLEKPAP